MANLKRLFVVVLTVAMIVTSMATAFGAPLTDISGKKYEDAVNKLAGFGIVAGDNGQFKGEDKLTRAEFATFIVKMMGLGEQSKVDTVFSDATSNDWYSGYVNVIAERGIMVGVGADTFAPNKNVTYGEAITVLMKMLGYTPVVDGRGTWPNNYISRASNIKLTKDVSVSGSADVTRGNLGLLMWKAMTTNKLVESGTYDENGNPTYEVAAAADNKTLLYENFNEAVAVDDTSIDPVAVTAVPLTSDAADINKVTVSGKSFSVPAGFDANSLLGMDIYYVADKDDNMVWVKVGTKAENIITDTVKEIQANTAGDAVDRIKFMTADKSYYAAPGMVLLYNGSKVGSADISKVLGNIAETTYVAGKQDPAKVTAVLDNDTKKIKTVSIIQDVASLSFKFNSSDIATTWFGIVGEVSDKFRGNGFNDLDFKDLMTKADAKSIKLFVTKNGKAATLNDVKKDDFIRYTAFGNTYIFSIFTPKIETLKFDSLEDTTDLTTVTIVAGDKRLKVGSAAYINQKTAYTDRANLSFDKLSNFMGVEGTKVYYGPSGKVNYFENQVADSAFKWAFVTDIDTATVDGKSVYKVTMYNSDGTTVSYDTTEGTIPTDGFIEDNYRAHVVAYKLSKDNEITTFETKTAPGSTTKAQGIITEVGPSNTAPSGDEYFKAAGTVGTVNYITSETVFLNWQKANYDAYQLLSSSAREDYNFQFDTISWDSVKQASLASSTFVSAMAYKEAGFNLGIAKFAVLRADAVSSVVKYAVVVGTGMTDDGKKTIRLNSKGVVNEYKVTESAYNVKGMVISYSVNASTATFVGNSLVPQATPVSNAVYDYNSVTGQLHYKKASGSNYVVGRVQSNTGTDRVVAYKNYDAAYTNGTVKGEATSTYLKDKAEIYDIRDVNNITYTTDATVLTKNTYFVYDRGANIVLIIKAADIYEQGQIGSY